jgi:hypothetical protein
MLGCSYNDVFIFSSLYSLYQKIVLFHALFLLLFTHGQASLLSVESLGMQHEFQMGGTRVLYIAKTDIYFHVWRILF